MIIDRTGDLLAADVDALVNTVNCVGIMGKGLALQFKRRYPDNYKQYVLACKNGEVQLGRMFIVHLGLTAPRFIINFPTKDHWKSLSRLADIETGLDDLTKVIEELEITSIAIPPLGAGNGGLPWSDVEPLIRRKLRALSEVDIHLYTPSDVSRHLEPKTLRMTWGRAVLIELIRQYVHKRLAVEPWEAPQGASHLEIQKLMYFAQLVMPSLKLRFERGIYGPYSDQVRHLIQEMEGAFLSGFGDGTAPVQRLDPIEPTTRGLKEAHRYIEESPERKDVWKTIVVPVIKMIEGFEEPYAIELLASTHWVATRELCVNPKDAALAIHSWSSRKGRLFTEQHVNAAWEHLNSAGLL